MHPRSIRVASFAQLAALALILSACSPKPPAAPGSPANPPTPPPAAPQPAPAALPAGSTPAQAQAAPALPPPEAQVPEAVPLPPPLPPAPENSAQPQLQANLPPLGQLLAPIALYPDPLVGLILPASTFPDQVQNADYFLQHGGDPSQAAAMPWDASIQGLIHYPDVLDWMNANIDWTRQLGGAFAAEPAAVMDAIQDLRRRAQAAGSLVNGPQEQVLVDNGTVEILPQQPDVIYVPQYDPAVVYVQQPTGFYPAGFFGWSRAYPAGMWLTYEFDWSRHMVWQGDWYRYRMENGGWTRPIDFAQARTNRTAWRPPPAPPPAFRPQAGYVQPRVMPGTPRPSREVGRQAPPPDRRQRPEAQPQRRGSPPQPKSKEELERERAQRERERNRQP